MAEEKLATRDEIRAYFEDLAELSGLYVEGDEKEMVLSALTDILDKQLSPKEAMKISDEMMNWLYEQAYKLHSSGTYKEAKALFEMLYSIEPDNPKHYFGAAACLHAEKNYESAVDAYFLCAMIAKTNPFPYYHAADCFFKLNDPLNALLMLKYADAVAKESGQHKVLQEKIRLHIQGIKKELGLEKAKETS